ncbi:hypothetical protein NDU88_006878, partial [Pleurodeles waltl]
WERVNPNTFHTNLITQNKADINTCLSLQSTPFHLITAFESLSCAISQALMCAQYPKGAKPQR